MAGPVVREGEPSVVGIEIASRPAQVRGHLSEFGVREPGRIREVDVSAALSRTARFFGMEEKPLAVNPFAVEVPDGTLRQASGRDARGGYITGTNIIMISELAMKPVYRPDAGERTMAHEMVHYFGFIGNGGQITYNVGGSARKMEMPEWLSEGITQSFAELILPSRDAPTYSYSYEVLSAVLLEKVAGLDVLREAYRTGDFRPVQEALDSRLGEGTFASLVGTGDGGSAYAFLYGRAFAMSAGGSAVSEEEYLSDLRVRGAMKSIDLLQDPGFRRLADEARGLRGKMDAGSKRRLDDIAREIMEAERLS